MKKKPLLTTKSLLTGMKKKYEELNAEEKRARNYQKGYYELMPEQKKNRIKAVQKWRKEHPQEYKLKSDFQSKKWKSKNYIYSRFLVSKSKQPFTLSFERYKEILEGSCVYCGSKERMSIDRKDSKKGYTFENSQSCCLICNIMKNSLTETDFLTHIKNIYRYSGLVK